MSPRKSNALVAQSAQFASVFAALGDETRLRLIHQLVAGEPKSIAELTTGTQLTRQAITKHLHVLSEAGIVHSTKAGRESLYAFNPQVIGEARDYLERVSAQWDDVLLRLKAFVEDQSD